MYFIFIDHIILLYFKKYSGCLRNQDAFLFKNFKMGDRENETNMYISHRLGVTMANYNIVQ